MIGLRTGPGALRILLAIMVVVSHFEPLEIGRVAVAIFFMLSGYWVVRMYRSKYVPMPLPAGRFYVSRILRIFPTYFAILSLTVAGLALMHGSFALGFTDFVIFGIAARGWAVLWPAWSLDIELQFYLVIPMICLVMGSRPSALRCWTFVIVAGALTALTWGLGIEHFPARGIGYALPFAIGAFSAFRDTSFGRNAAAVSLALFLVPPVAACLVPDFEWLLFKDYQAPIDHDIVAMLWAALLTPFIYWNVRLPSGKLDRALGDLAYTSYLCHWFYVLEQERLFGWIPTGPVRLPLILIVVSGTALFIYLIIERPLEHGRRALLERWSAGRARKAATVSE